MQTLWWTATCMQRLVTNARVLFLALWDSVNSRNVSWLGLWRTIVKKSGIDQIATAQTALNPFSSTLLLRSQKKYFLLFCLLLVLLELKKHIFQRKIWTPHFIGVLTTNRHSYKFATKLWDFIETRYMSYMNFLLSLKVRYEKTQL